MNWADKSVWVFDLDNTLYDAASDLYDQIGARMTDYVARLLGVDPVTAKELQERYYLSHGATLSGLMAVHGADPKPFLDYVHDVDVSPVRPDPDLGALVDALPGRKVVFTNGSHGHAERVVRRLGLEGLFDDYFDIEDCNFRGKPTPEAYSALIARHAIAPARAVMFEDLARNLAPAAALGFTTVLVRSEKDWSHEPEAARPAGRADPLPAHVHHATDCLKTFLRGVLAQV